MPNFLVNSVNLGLCKVNNRKALTTDYYSRVGLTPVFWWKILIPKGNAVIDDLLLVGSGAYQGIRFNAVNLGTPATATITFDGYKTGMSLKSGVISKDAIQSIFSQAAPALTTGIAGIGVGFGLVSGIGGINLLLVDAFGINSIDDSIIFVGGGGGGVTPARIPSP